MTDLDARVAALMDDADTYAATQRMEDRYELEQAIRAELQKPALHEPCTQHEAGEALGIFASEDDSALEGMRNAIDFVLQGRAKPAQETSISNIQIIADPSVPQGEAVFKQDGKEVGRITNIGDAQKPAQETTLPSPEITWLYTHCRAIGMTCKSDSGKWQDDIALWTIRLTEEIEQLKGPAQEEITDAERLNFLLQNFESGWSEEDNGWYSWSYNNRGELSGESKHEPPDIITCIDAAIRASKGEKT